MRDERIEAPAYERRELRLGSLTRGAHGGHDAAAGGLHLEVRGAAEPLRVLAGALAGERRVRVRVDEAGNHAGAFGVDDERVVARPHGGGELRSPAPTHTMRPARAATAASRTTPRSARELIVTSSPMPRTSRSQVTGAPALTGGRAGGRPAGRHQSLPAARTIAAKSPALTARADASISGAR